MLPPIRVQPCRLNLSEMRSEKEGKNALISPETTSSENYLWHQNVECFLKRESNETWDLGQFHYVFFNILLVRFWPGFRNSLAYIVNAAKKFKNIQGNLTDAHHPSAWRRWLTQNTDTAPAANMLLHCLYYQCKPVHSTWDCHTRPHKVFTVPPTTSCFGSQSEWYAII